MKHKLAIILTLITVVAFCSTIFVSCDSNENFVEPNKVDYADIFVTTGDMTKLLTQEASVQFLEYTKDDKISGVTVTVNENKSLQSLYGYGASLTHSSAYLLEQEGAENIATQVLEELFGESGARFSLVRIPIGASDYIEGDNFFTCDDLCDNSVDINLEHFTLENDIHLISVLKKIIAINKNIQIIACPWSAPAWMKNNGSLIGGELKEEYYSTYADYLVKFIESYKEEGIDISYLSLVNEPMVRDIKYPHMCINEHQALEIGQMVNERLEGKSSKVKLLGWEHNVEKRAFDFIDTLFGEENNDIFAGVAYHGYSDVNKASVSDGADYVREYYSDKLVFLTEITEHSGSTNFANNLTYASRYTTLDPLNYGLNGAMFWNYVLRSDGSPTLVDHGGDCYGLIDLDYNDSVFSYSKRSAYYAMAHISKFAYEIDGVYPRVLETYTTDGYKIVACSLHRADGAIIACASNISDLSENVHFVVNGKKVTVNIPPKSVVTVLYQQ